MTLKNKDGTVYKLPAPNPLMKQQKLWTDFQVHNMKWKPEKQEDSTELIPVHSDFSVKEEFLNELEQTKPQEPIQVVERIPVVEKSPEETKEDIKKTFVHCLPGHLEEKRDDLLGEVYRTVEYGNPFSFEGIVLDHQDLYLKVWTTEDIQRGSILYPRSEIKRWWRVQEREAKENGWILTSIPSDYHPSF